MLFKYVASQPDGQLAEGELDVADTSEVLTFLRSRDLKPVSVQSLAKAEKKHLQLFGGGITLIDQIFITRYLALMLKIGTSLLQAINILIGDFSKPAVRAFLIEVRSNLEKGLPFYLTFSRYPKEFSATYINSVKAGETSGNLQAVFEDLTLSLTKEKAFKDEIKSALAYPIFLFTLSLLIFIFLIAFALPKIAKVFLESGFDPPIFSRVVFSIGLFFSGTRSFLLLGFVVGGAVTLFVSGWARRFIGTLFSRIPLVNKLLTKIALQRFAATLSSLVKANIPIAEALEITASTVGKEDIAQALRRVAREGIAKGLTVGGAFKREAAFPTTVTSLIAIAEQSGHIEEVLATLAEFYAGEINSLLKMLVSFLEPVLLLFIGFVVGLIALSVIIPIYQLTTQF